MFLKNIKKIKNRFRVYSNVLCTLTMGFTAMPPGWEDLATPNLRSQVVKDEFLVVFPKRLSVEAMEAIETVVLRNTAVVKKTVGDYSLLIRVLYKKRLALFYDVLNISPIEFISRNYVATQLSSVKGEDCNFSGSANIEQIFDNSMAFLQRGCRLINLSMSIVRGENESDIHLLDRKRRWRQALIPLVLALRDNNATLILAAGNNGVCGDDTLFRSWVQEAYQLAWRNHVIVVGASGHDNRPTDFSDKGSVVDIYAPGIDITVPEIFTHPGAEDHSVKIGVVDIHAPLIDKTLWPSLSHAEVVSRLIKFVAPNSQVLGLPHFILSKKMNCSGTSFAAPIVVSTLALALLPNVLPPQFPAGELKKLLIETSQQGPDGIRIPNALNLVKAALRVKEQDKVSSKNK